MLTSLLVAASLLALTSPAVADEYIVVMKPGESCAELAATMQAKTSWTALPNFNGFVAELSKSQISELEAYDSVAIVEKNGIMQALATQKNPPSWGLSRVGQRELPIDQSRYLYKDSAGRGVDVYVVDTGIMTSHADFGGRAEWGFVADEHSSEGETDVNGHGTHCAGTIGGLAYGVAKAVNLYAVKVLGGIGSGGWDSVISGINYVAEQRMARGRPTVMSLSLGGGISSAVNAAIDAAADLGVHNAIAAGNDGGKDACDVSPASASKSFTVAAADIRDEMASFTNLGPCVDIFAPGVDIESAWIGSNDANRTISGTSMATPHVAGVKALFLSESGEMDPAELDSMVIDIATKEAILLNGTVQPWRQPAKEPLADECQTDADCFCYGPKSCCKPSGKKNYCTILFESCCAGSTCQAFPEDDESQHELCANPTVRYCPMPPTAQTPFLYGLYAQTQETGDAFCCPAGTEVLADGTCYNKLVDTTPSSNLYADP